MDDKMSRDIRPIATLLMSQFVAALLAACAPATNAPQTDPVVRLENELRGAREVTFYFVDRTEDYDYTAAQMMEHAQITITRRCASNCLPFMKDVSEHMRAAVPAKCLKGQQNVLVRLDKGAPIIYSYSGRHILYGGNCYLNRAPINDRIEREEFVF